MKRTDQYNPAILLLLMAATTLFACSTSKKGLFAKKTAHEQYATQITDAGLNTTTLGRLWFAAAEKALVRPMTISLPYRETGYFAAEKPDAAGYIFSAKRGERVNVQVTMKPQGSFLLFAELWQSGTGGNKPSLLAAADTTTWQLQYEVERDGQLQLRLQPELLRSGEYSVVITTAPTLAFPVAPKAYYKIGSFWGDARDRGARKHEGIDIFGKFRTPVVAAADGYVTSTRENNLGGKVVFLQPDGKDYTLYYAHLDSQLVRQGQRVAKGAPVGLMGNTGNARTTPTHLHFGIYTAGGAVDPMPFVNPERATPAAVTAPLELLRQDVRNTTATSLRASPAKAGMTMGKLPSNQVMQVLAATGDWYRVVLPDAREGFIESAAVTDKSYRTLVLKNAAPLLDTPDSLTAVKTTMPEGSSINILGGFGEYQYVRYKTLNGWIRRSGMGSSN
jgi:murein DD-endopeptidase MepM/ murein hydrolase activator NlpD